MGDDASELHRLREDNARLRADAALMNLEIDGLHRQVRRLKVTNSEAGFRRDELQNEMWNKENELIDDYNELSDDYHDTDESLEYYMGRYLSTPAGAKESERQKREELLHKYLEKIPYKDAIKRLLIEVNNRRQIYCKKPITEKALRDQLPAKNYPKKAD
jgi:hypothetical protein